MLPTDLIGIYGKEKSTKTTLTHQIVLDIALEQKIPVAVFNFEMDVIQILMKTFSMRSGISTNVLRNPKQNIIPDSEFDIKAERLRKDFEDAKLFVIDEMLNEQQIYNKSKELVKSYGVKLIVIDYLMLIEPSVHKAQRRDELNDLSRFFKRMAKKLNVIIILVSQANDSGMREAEAKGLSRDSNYYFYVEQLGQGQEIKIAGESYKAQEGDYAVINRGIRHDLGNRAFITRFIENKYCEITIKSKYYPEELF
jgi:replicative DNA helicase